MPTPFTLLSLATSRETERSGWHARDAGGYDVAYARAIAEPVATQPDRLLAAIPSPFARLHGLDIAFDFLADPKTPIDGETVFHVSVSRCLDALELLFNWHTHRERGVPLKLVRWQPADEIDKLLDASRREHAVLGEALKLYLDQDAALADDVTQEGRAPDGLWMVCVDLGSRLSALAISSPLTIISPVPEAATLAFDAGLRMEERPTEQAYFTANEPLTERPPAFQAYVRALFRFTALTQQCERMYRYQKRVTTAPNVVRAMGPYASQVYQPIRTPDATPITVHGVTIGGLPAGGVPPRIANSPRRIRSERGERSHEPVFLVDNITSAGTRDATFKAPERDRRALSDRKLPDENLKYPFLIASDFFEDAIVRVPYALNTTAFILPPSASGPAKSFLPPITRTYLDFFSEASIGTRLRFLPLQGDGVTCELDIPLADGSTLTISKSFYPVPRLPGTGAIVDTDATLIGFPMMRPIRTGDKGGVQPAFGDATVFLLAELERSQLADVPWRTELEFYQATDEGAIEPIDADVSMEERTPKQAPTFTGSRIYTIDAPLPAAIALVVTDDAGNRRRALLCPAARPREVGKEQFEIAIDFGTTNTFVMLGRRQAGGRAPETVPMKFAAGMEPVLALHAPNQTGILTTPAEKLADHEFVPLRLGVGRQTLPTRTAVAERPGTRTLRLFQDVNVAFFLQRDAVRPDAEIVTTDLKWMLRSDPDTAERVRLFLRELLYLVRTNILLRGGDPARSRLIWFWPLSFTTYLRDTLDRVWREEALRVLGISESDVGSMTESAAPFYYHEARGAIASDKPVLSIDVGGGSTDVVFFEKKKPRFGSSFNFAGRALWGDGYNDVRTVSDRSGVVEWALPRIERALQGVAQQERRMDARQIVGPLEHWAGPSEEAINLCFAVDEVVRFSEQMRGEPLIKVMILLHFSAIIFHCAHIMRLRKLVRPHILCFSGFGSKAFDVLDSSSGKRHLGEHAQRIFDVVYDHWDEIEKVAITDDPRSGAEIIAMMNAIRPTGALDVKMAKQLKEATCEGGILGVALNDALRVTPEPFVYLGGRDETLFERDRAISYDQLERDTTIKPEVVANVRRFVAMFIGFADRYNVFGIPIGTVADQRELLWSDVAEMLDLGLERRLRREESSEEPMTESLFFYPLIDKLVKIGKRLS
jgi:hypothetical protein